MQTPLTDLNFTFIRSYVIIIHQQNLMEYMKSIVEIISPITLLRGSHGDTGQTGQGCFMNVAAYLNGDLQITDDSPCVCFTVKPFVIWFNDFLNQKERQELIPFIGRAMGSATDDQDLIIDFRLKLVVEFAKDLSVIAAGVGNKTKIKRAIEYASGAVYAASRFDTHGVITAANSVAFSASPGSDSQLGSVRLAAYREQIKAATFKFLGSVLPKNEPHGTEVLNRAKKLVELAGEYA
jgi:hypothetical protein